MSPKAINVPPQLNSAPIPKTGAEVEITDVREVRDQWTSIGTCKHGIALTVEFEGEEYSQMFSLDKDPVTGSAGRVLTSVGIEDTLAKDFATKIQELVGKKIRVAKREGKIYWYP